MFHDHVQSRDDVGNDRWRANLITGPCTLAHRPDWETVARGAFAHRRGFWKTAVARRLRIRLVAPCVQRYMARDVFLVAPGSTRACHQLVETITRMGLSGVTEDAKGSAHHGKRARRLANKALELKVRNLHP